MELSLSLALPRDALSVPVARTVLRGALLALGALEDVVGDIELALTEACTNVLDHAATGDDYAVVAGLDGGTCVIEVVDRGSSSTFDPSAHGYRAVADDAEQGRGILLMRALVDSLEFQEHPDSQGTVVRLRKAVQWREGALAAQLDAVG